MEMLMSTMSHPCGVRGYVQNRKCASEKDCECNNNGAERVHTPLRRLSVAKGTTDAGFMLAYPLRLCIMP